jgi:hypothetical protein
LELIKITESGEIILANGQVNRQSSYSDCVKLFGELISRGDYQSLNFFSTKNSLKLRENEIIVGLVFRNENIYSLQFHLSDNEINSFTKNLTTDKQKITKVKEIVSELLTALTNETGEKAKGRRYFKTYSWGFLDLMNPTKKWPLVTVNYKTD